MSIFPPIDFLADGHDPRDGAQSASDSDRTGELAKEGEVSIEHGRIKLIGLAIHVQPGAGGSWP